MSEERKCSGKVYNPRGSWGHKYNACSRKGVVEREGKWYCKQHDPVAVAARREESDRKYAARFREECNLDGRKASAIKACDGCPDEWLKPGILKRAIEALEVAGCAKANSAIAMERAARPVLDEIYAKENPCSGD